MNYFPRQLDELKSLRQWVAYRLVWNEKKSKSDKLPINPHTGENAKANDPSTWGSYDEAINFAICQGFFDSRSGGIGFEFANGYCGIDLDNVVLEDGSLKTFAEDIVKTMNSYTEYSPSGKGLHILCKLSESLSNFGTRRRNDEIGLEMYDSGRFFTVTGEVFGGAEVKTVENRQEEARKIYERYLHVNENKNSNTPHLRTSNEVFFSGLTDSELWQRIFSSQHGREIFELYRGNISAYGEDHSRADLALCSHLAYWTNCDEAQIDRMFRDSGLMRPKWDEMHGAQTYGAMTIAKALSTVTPYVKPAGNVVEKLKSDDISPVNVSEDSVLPEVLYVGSYLDIALESDIGRFMQFSNRKTGYSNIDEKTNLYPGLYVLGAVSSLGKTTFAYQMADQLAGVGEHVLFFVLEQTRLELVTKGLSRLTAQENLSTAVSAIEIREGRVTEAVRRAIAKYKRLAEHEAIIECNFSTSISDILNVIITYIQKYGVKPIVFVDYLQLIKPYDNKMTTKDAVDVHVRALKKLQMENDLVVVLISSLNRQNYLTPIDFESFKESGGIEYTADVIWGLQLHVMNSEIFDTDKKLKSKREIIKQAKRENPRKIELCVLKNRYGLANSTYYFDYYANYDLFVPIMGEIGNGFQVNENHRTRL